MGRRHRRLPDVVPQGLGRTAHLRRDRLDGRPLRAILSPVLLDQPHRPLPHLRGVPRPFVHGSNLSTIGASGNPGAIQTVIERDSLAHYCYTSGVTPDSHSRVRVSIIVPLYNGERFLAVTLDAALAQTFADFELIVVDDGSTDHSHEVLKRYGDPRLRIVRQENSGAAGALMMGVGVATGEYIAFLDQDDVWEPDSVAAHVDFLDRNPAIEATFSWFRIINAQGCDTGLRSHRYCGTIGFSALLADFVIGGNSNLVCRRTAIDQVDGFDTSFRLIFNVDLCLRIALLSSQDNIAAIPRDLMRYRRHGQQLSRQHEDLREEWFRMLDKIGRIAPREMAAVRSVALANLYRYTARVLYEDARYEEALRMLAASLRRVPHRFLADPRNWVTSAASLSGFLLPDRLHRRLEKVAGYHRSADEKL